MLKLDPKPKNFKKPSFFVVFLVISEVFQTFLVLGPILAHQTKNLNSVDNFASLDARGGPEGVKVVE